MSERRSGSTVGTVVSAALLAVCLYVGARPVGPVPALGSFLDPVKGVWSSARSATLPATVTHTVPGLSGDVRIVYDDRRVPHIFAESVVDVVRGLGYTVARDRLFQLELQTRATAGTLTELVGVVALEADRQSRQLALAWSAERDYSRVEPGSELTTHLDAYADGVNAWMRAMSPSEVPLEYHLLGRAPTAWQPQHSLYLLKRMGWTLAMINTERRKTAAAALVGREAADGLFPVNAPIQEPIQPNGLRAARFEPITLPPPGEPDLEMIIQSATLQTFLGPVDSGGNDDGETVLGSNNWAIGPSRSAEGHAILAGDPHLDFTLPSIWYEAHLVVPGELDVYGVTVPGTPTITIGFNRDLAWTFTNTGSDVMDLYRETVDDAERPRSYLLDGEWRPFEERIETYRAPDGSVLAVDTILHSHRGPASRDSGQYVSLRWTVLEDQGELSALLDINRARSVDEWMSAMASWVAPTQNGLVADRQGNIAIRSTGRYPIRPPGARGDWAFDGATSSNDWQGWYPVSSYPGSVNPVQGYLTSSNQQPVDPEDNPRYLGANWPSPWRAMRINQLLRADSVFTATELSRFQTDPGSPRADVFVEAFLEAARGRSGQATDRGAAEEAGMSEAGRLLAEWDRLYTKDNTRAALFELAMNELAGRTWDELADTGGRRVATPRTAILAALLADPTNAWWDDQSTPDVVEGRDDILNSSLDAALRAARDAYGAETEEGWTWSRVANANVVHFLGMSAFSALNLPIRGGPETLNPNTGNGRNGASWRMVVELGDEVEGRGTYPGGQSGHPLSQAYLDRIDDWVEGKLQPLRFPRSAEEITDLSRAEAILRPESRR